MFYRAQVSQGSFSSPARSGSGWLSAVHRTDQALDEDTVIAPGAIVGGLYSRSGTNTSRTDTLPTGAQLAAELEGMDIGDTFIFAVGNFTLSPLIIAASEGIVAGGNLTIDAGVSRFFLVEKTAAEEFTVTGF